MDWEIFKITCQEFYGNNSDVIKLAEFGILCHHGKLPNDVRYTMEKLMRLGNPKIIIATHTLAQGVNLGVSSVIIANDQLGKDKYLSKRDFWNIAGRAGRAFIDTEGKILYAVNTFEDNQNTQIKINANIKRANDYLSNNELDKSYSGLFLHILGLYQKAWLSGVDFDHLIQLVAENSITELSKISPTVIELFDRLDDTLLSFDNIYENYDLDSSNWIDDHFRTSLANIQAEKYLRTFPADVIAFLKARNKFVKQQSGHHNNWKRLIATSLPLQSAQKLFEILPSVISILEAFQTTPQHLNDWLDLLKQLELKINELPSKEFKNAEKHENIDILRKTWLSGKPVDKEENLKFISSYFAYTVPWVLNAMAQQIAFENTELSSILEELTLFCELGLPNKKATEIYFCGIRSRTASSELSLKLNNPEDLEIKVKDLAQYIIAKSKDLERSCTELTKKWLNVLRNSQQKLRAIPKWVSNWEFPSDVDNWDSSIIYLRKSNTGYFLCSPDYKEKLKVEGETDLDDLIERSDIYFERTVKGIKMRSRFRK